MTYKASVRIAAPGADLISTAQAKRWVRRDDDDDIEDIELLIAAAMSHLDGLDGILRRALIDQDWTDQWSAFPTGQRMPLVMAPVSAIIGVSYFDAANVERTLPVDAYSLHRDFAGAYLCLDPAVTWPGTFERADAVAVSYTAGYGPSAAHVPAEIRLAARELIECWYGCEEGRSGAVPPGVMTKLRRFIRPHF